MLGANLYQFGHFTEAFGGAGAAWTLQPSRGTGVFTETGLGDVSINLQAEAGADAARSAWFGVSGDAMAVGGSDQSCVAITHTNDLRKRIMCLQEQAAGAASILADHTMCFAGFTEAGPLWGRIVAAGSVTTAGVPAFRNRSSLVAAVARTAGWVAGGFDVTLAQGGFDATDLVVLASIRGAQVATGLTKISCTQTSDTVKNFYVLQETGGLGQVSAPANVDFDFVMIARGSMNAEHEVDYGVKPYALGSVTVNGALPNTLFVWQGPRLGAVITYNAAGDTTLQIPDAIADVSSVVLITPRVVLAPCVAAGTGMYAHGYVRPNATSIRVTSVNEVAAAASAARDCSYDIGIFKID